MFHLFAGMFHLFWGCWGLADINEFQMETTGKMTTLWPTSTSTEILWLTPKRISSISRQNCFAAPCSHILNLSYNTKLLMDIMILPHPCLPSILESYLQFWNLKKVQDKCCVFLRQNFVAQICLSLSCVSSWASPEEARHQRACWAHLGACVLVDETLSRTRKPS